MKPADELRVAAAFLGQPCPENPLDDIDVGELLAKETLVPNVAYDAVVALLRDFLEAPEDTERCQFCDVTHAQLVLDALDFEQPDAQRAAVLLLERARRAREATP
jgi:hypothetical protein